MTLHVAALAPLQERVGVIRDNTSKKPGCIENALLENRNPNAKPEFVGVPRCKSFKHWEALWGTPPLTGEQGP